MVNWNGILVVMGDFNEVKEAGERYGVVLEKGIPDHHLNILKEFEVDYGPTSFWFFHSWLKMEGFHNLVNREWVASKKSISYKLKKDHLKRFSSIDAKVDQGCASEEDIMDRKDSLYFLGELDRMEANDLAQKAKIKWALEGDENTSFFHDAVSFNPLSPCQRDNMEIISLMVKSRELFGIVVVIVRRVRMDSRSSSFFTIFCDLIEDDVACFVLHAFTCKAEELELFKRAYIDRDNMSISHLIIFMGFVEVLMLLLLVVPALVLGEPFCLRLVTSSRKFDALQAVVENVALSDQCDSWQWSLDVSARYSVASVRALVDAHILDVDIMATSWNRAHLFLEGVGEDSSVAHMKLSHVCYKFDAFCNIKEGFFVTKLENQKKFLFTYGMGEVLIEEGSKGLIVPGVFYAPEEEGIEQDLVIVKGNLYSTKVQTFNDFVTFLNLIKNDDIVSQEWDIFRNRFNKVVKWFFNHYLDRSLPGPIPPVVNGVEIHLFDLYKLIENLGGYLSVHFSQDFDMVGEIMGLSKGNREEIKRCYMNFLEIFTSHFKTTRALRKGHNNALMEPALKAEKDKECLGYHRWDFGEDGA
nr:ARID DNA-binding domain-containing protein [Tanacetum cinerariifolium]